MSIQFSLQPVLDYRHQKVEALEVELSQLLASHQQGSDMLQSLNGFQTHLFEQMKQQKDGVIDLQAVTQMHSNLKVVEARIQQQKMLLKELENKIDSKRDDVIHAKQDEETLNTLKAKELVRYQAEQARQESRLQDDIYIAQAYRRGIEI
jgi:flagellar export protein FliJ